MYRNKNFQRSFIFTNDFIVALDNFVSCQTEILYLHWIFNKVLWISNYRTYNALVCVFRFPVGTQPNRTLHCRGVRSRWISPETLE